ncbi:RNA 2',3'-cyclic phosphodiesterase [Isoptericola sp. b441]|uniref:RNA 2',3'-cyclic phosphodiesterase n=1 Tax=Actinotalea lenta TaxID=3064654 RepID=A0ABT9DEF0_9CELL|nr:RNA 2',3'-cyclic phosphodiesterase [Isoptericola sp. b441]MDO8107457.1 RNA 2',3'-cyclic phosphodiesterase [Isoptericola sp. b441]
MRLFASLRPPVPVLDHLRHALVLATAGAELPVRWTAEENWHLTVAFYGEVPDGAADELADALAEVAAGVPPFSLRLRGAGVFAGRTVWVGAAGDLDAMATLAARARAAGESISAFRDRERLRPHLTVGRVVAEPRRRVWRRVTPTAVDRLVHALALYEGPTWTVDTLLLEQSWPGAGRGGGPLYDTRASHPLG